MRGLRVLNADEVADEPLHWPVRSHTSLGAGAISEFVSDVVQTPDGQLMTRDYLLHPGAVGVIALDDAERRAAEPDNGQRAHAHQAPAPDVVGHWLDVLDQRLLEVARVLDSRAEGVLDIGKGLVAVVHPAFQPVETMR